MTHVSYLLPTLAQALSSKLHSYADRMADTQVGSFDLIYSVENGTY